MSVSSWPGSLPQQLLVSGYSGTLPDTLIKSDMDAGPGKVRRRFTAGVEPVKGNMVLSADELADLETFYNGTLLGGALRFSWTKPPAHADPCEMRFTSAPKWTTLGGDNYEVSLELEIMP